MKVVLSGSTGFIGGEALAQCLKHPSITSLVVLSRREIPELATNPKAKVVVVKDFSWYDEDVTTVEELHDADAAIWCVGTYNGDELIDVEFPLAFIRAVRAHRRGPAPFRYVHLGGAFTEPPPKEGEPERQLWYFGNGRRVRGAAEAKVMDTADEEGPEEGRLQVYVVKPGAVASRRWAFTRCVVGDSLSVTIDELGAAMVDLAVKGSERRIWLNQEIVKHGKEVLAAQNQAGGSG